MYHPLPYSYSSLIPSTKSASPSLHHRIPFGSPHPHCSKYQLLAPSSFSPSPRPYGSSTSSSTSKLSPLSSDASRNQSIAFIGPADVASHTNLNYTSHTYAASTKCQVFHPECYVENEAVQYCYPTFGVDDPELVISGWNSFVWEVGFDTTNWQVRLQSFKAGVTKLPGYF